MASTTIRSDPKLDVISITKWQFVGTVNGGFCGKLTAIQRRDTNSSSSSTLGVIRDAFERGAVILYNSVWTVEQVLNEFKNRKRRFGAGPL